ncbi:MAG: MraY family glycosyltransferase [Chloroflexia bacterium]
MIQYAAILLSAVAIAVFVTPLVRNAATRFGVTDTPSARKIHAEAVPLLGGAAIWCGFVLTLLLFDTAGFVKQFGSIIVGATIVSVVGLWDDRQGIKPALKLLGQIIAAVLIVAFGTSIHFASVLTAAFGVQLQNNDQLDLAVTILWVVGITNALNLLDNMDGLAGGVAAWASFFLFLLALMSSQRYVALLALALAGACIGFLYYNFRPGHIFMGDTGSLFLGFMLAAVGIKLRFPVLYDPITGVAVNHQAVTWMIPLLVLGLPIFDTALVTISRLRRRLPISRGGRDHTSHRLVALGMNHHEAVLLLYIICLLFGIAAIAVAYLPVAEAQILGLCVLAAAALALWRLEQVPLVDTNPAMP